ncbi:N-acetylmuramoyl-L-alanine amidase [Aphanizomenon flos-aquae NRERC-008]|uniref:N-acetylmuramoyl-L-alanine amidase n=1 Tax=Aphanizomenon flos-aquae FACHB-1249 TaxID=2692889 RepID=A0ABR8IU28_APHFL|nr:MULTISPECIES: N-acetylmuramoyl-L-alanine amidase [Aphanizomenon]MBD2392439.1 N-acetylmuramoyl-L-alanine amidase [Aphanizomenon flos-aquae FACHB-1171]MBD2558709.1 N-acetylmuramoyl-L-alanine amidase [Aphanizomenon flos-aquae FACHB-1290]MBD2632248.1 N-acetylmuramoyl-L-alanine amidase [Aphanizomenon sp. FACHB-1399]MBD2659144.1 N-acetylmuramoyl-L-alanine amidase [Aphanizomenon flos-aquae FACHB-1265]MBD2675510.1 N-acetylmuramoyl-L-alanine amidase [Aphanizomenon flos-aquae FACHB-1416]MBD2686225.1
MKLQWLIPATFGTVIMLSSPTLAAKLESWRFDRYQNLLEINTNSPVKPEAQLIFNPTRLVIDLPGVKLGRSQLPQQIGGGIREIRVGQFDEQKTRIVLELNPGYNLDPQQIKFLGKSPNRWTVQLPKLATDSSLSTTNNTTSNNNNYNLANIDPQLKPEFSPIANNSKATTQIEKLQITGDGFFIRTNGGNPQTRIIRSQDKTTIFLDILGATVLPSLTQGNLAVNKYGVDSIGFTQLQTTPTSVRITLKVNENSPDWQVTSSSSGLVVLPSKRIVNAPENENFPPIRTNNSSPATIQSVELTDNGTQLLIRADQVISATTGWDRSSGLFRITIANAKLANEVQKPTLDPNSSILKLRLQSQPPNTVVILIQPASGVTLSVLNQEGDKFLALKLQRYRQIRPIVNLPPLSPPKQPLPDLNSSQPQTRPRRPVRQGKIVVIIDPGHGGKDPGAIGIGGVQEKNIILPIGKRIAEILERNGIQVIMTRDSDYFVTLPGRVTMAEQANASVFVSIHANSAGENRPEVSGLETYHYDTGLTLARIVHSKILQSLNIRDRSVRRARFYVLRKNSMPAILVETGYLTGRDDVAKLRTSAYQNQMAEAIAQGILQYLRSR